MSVARNWDKIAQPIQLSSKARGIDHEASRDLAYEIRSLAIDLFNKHDMLAQSQRLTGLIQELFSEVPKLQIGSRKMRTRSRTSSNSASRLCPQR
jgi:hypothetical protein